MSLQTDAETIGPLIENLRQFEIAKSLANNAGAVTTIATVQIKQSNGAITIFDVTAMNIAITGAQKTAAFAAESGWQTTIKNLTAAWVP